MTVAFHILKNQGADQCAQHAHVKAAEKGAGLLELQGAGGLFLSCAPFCTSRILYHSYNVSTKFFC